MAWSKKYCVRAVSHDIAMGEVKALDETVSILDTVEVEYCRFRFVFVHAHGVGLASEVTALGHAEVNGALALLFLKDSCSILSSIRRNLYSA